MKTPPRIFLVWIAVGCLFVNGALALHEHTKLTIATKAPATKSFREELDSWPAEAKYSFGAGIALNLVSWVYLLRGGVTRSLDSIAHPPQEPMA